MRGQALMILRIGYELSFELKQPTPVILMLGVHSSRVNDLLVRDDLQTSPALHIEGFWDIYGNWCNRFLAPAGLLTISADALLNDSGIAEIICSKGRQTEVEKLPSEALLFLLGSRYCETDMLSEIAWDLFEDVEPGAARVHQNRFRSTQESFRRMQGFCPSRHCILPVYEYTGPILHGLPL
jgi:hypothetical protein